MTKKLRFGIWNIIGHIIGALFVGTLLIYLAFIRPIEVGDPHGLTGGKHTVFSIVLIYLVGSVVFIVAVTDTILMIQAMRKAKRNKGGSSMSND